MTPTTPSSFDDRPATKRDVAEMAQTMMSDLEKTKKELKDDIDGVRGEVKDGFERIEQLLSAPTTGLIPRLKRVEEAVGIPPTE